MVISYLVSLTSFYRFTLPRQREHTVPSAKSIKFTRSVSTKRARTPWLCKEREDMMLSKEVMVDRQNPFSKRSPRLQRRLLSSLSVVLAREEEWLPSSVARLSFLVRRTLATRVVPLSEHTVSVTPYYSIKLLSTLDFIIYVTLFLYINLILYIILTLNRYLNPKRNCWLILF